MRLRTFVLAAETVASGGLSESMKTALTNAFKSVQDNFMSVLEIALPIALGIVAVTLAIRYGIAFFKRSSH